MKLKYYMRGVGVGIIFTAFLFVAIIIPNLKFENKVTGSASQPDSAENVSGLLGSGEKQNAAEPADNPVKVSAEEYETAGEQELTEEQGTAEEQVNEEAFSPAISGNEPADELSAKENMQATMIEITESEGAPALFPGRASSYSTEHTKAVIEINTGNVILRTYSGCTPEEVCLTLYEMGLIDDEKALKDHIYDNGYDEKLQTDRFVFAPGASFEDICKKMTESD